jgi:transposase
MDAKQLHEDARSGKIGVDDLLDVISHQTKTIDDQTKTIDDQTKTIDDQTKTIDDQTKTIAAQGKTIVAQGKTAEKLQGQLDACLEQLKEIKAKQDGHPTQRLEESYSMSAEERRQARKSRRKEIDAKTKRTGRGKNDEKLERATREENVYPEGVAADACQFSHSRPMWRLLDGKATLVAYHIYRSGNRFGQIVGGVGRTEFGVEIHVALAHLVYATGLSIEKACDVLGFFQELALSRSQANSLLNRLAKHWEQEFDHLCDILAHSAVVHTDETSWSLNSVWVFIGEKVQLLFHGVHKDAATLEAILHLDAFPGVIVSDDAAIYRDLSKAQKCWAHLLRKAFKLALICPKDRDYRRFADRLLQLYRDACAAKSDETLSAEDRGEAVLKLADRLTRLCKKRYLDPTTTQQDTPEHSFKLLVNELMRLLDAGAGSGELFTFVTNPLVEGTNNAAERELRGAATARSTGRTNKSFNGARRRTIIVSVLLSLGKQLGSLRLRAIVDEVNRWVAHGKSCFEELVEQSEIEPRGLDVVCPKPG